MSKIYKFKKDENLLHYIILTVTLALVMGFILMVFLSDKPPKKPIKERAEPPKSSAIISGPITGSAQIMDGDSLIINGIEIRFHGIDAPEIDQPCWRGNAQYQCGKTAKNYLGLLIDNKPITCQARNKDQYGRTIAKCFNHNGQDLQALMASGGHAVAYLYYSRDYEGQQNEAKKAKRGIWAGRFTEPYDFRQRSR